MRRRKPRAYRAGSFDPMQVILGTETEMEHEKTYGWAQHHPKAPVREVAMRVALDHLNELSDYYTRLAAMERQAEIEKSVAKAKKKPKARRSK